MTASPRIWKKPACVRPRARRPRPLTRRRSPKARGKANAIAGEARARLAAETDANRKSLEENLNAKLADAERRIASTKATALSHVRGIAVDTTGAIVTALVGTPAGNQDVESAVDAALAAKSA